MLRISSATDDGLRPARARLRSRQPGQQPRSGLRAVGKRANSRGAEPGRHSHTGLPGEITYLRVHGRRVAFIGFAPYAFAANLLDIPGAQRLIRRARAHASLVVVIIHAGAEGAGELHTPHGEETYLGEDRGDARAFAHAAIDAGASLVLGSGPHVIRGVERYRGRLIAYSLGNFVGYSHSVTVACSGRARSCA